MNPAPPFVPPPPPGPGVHPPFPAPPVEGRSRRLGLTLGIGAGVVVLVCGAGIAASIGAATSMHGALNERAQKPVTEFLDAVRGQRFDQAYAMLCRSAKQDETPSEFRTAITKLQPIRSYEVGDLDLVNLAVPVAATYQNGDQGELQAYLEQNQSTAEFEVCKLEG